MLFGRKTTETVDIQKIHQCLQTFFQLTIEQVETWLTVESSKITIRIPFACETQHQELSAAIKLLVAEQVQLEIQTHVQPVATKIAPIANIKNVIAVASGKGGVGKSTTSVNLAYGLIAEGAKVGILDADIYGPSIPLMLGNGDQKPTSQDNKKVDPLSAYGLVASSIGYFVAADDATVWRGPMASKALHQLINETAWPELDYLIVDMPPGTGDIQLTLAQQIPVSGAVIVTTPQDLALADASKGIAMFNKVDTPVLGVVENMSYHQCVNCGHKEAIFAEHGGDKLAVKYQLPLLAKLPLNIQIRQHGESGTPLQIAEPDNNLSQSYRQLARQTAKYCYLKGLPA